MAVALTHLHTVPKAIDFGRSELVRLQHLALARLVRIMQPQLFLYPAKRLAMFGQGDKGKRVAVLAGASGASNTVDVCVGMGREVKVHNPFDVDKVNTARHLGAGDHQGGGLSSQLQHDSLEMHLIRLEYARSCLHTIEDLLVNTAGFS